MRVARSLEEAAEFGPVAVTIGNFDGVHLGHQRLLDEVVKAAREKGIAPAALTFDPHPAMVLAPQRSTRLLTNQAERCSILAREGIEYVLVLPFTSEFSHWPPERFVERVLHQAMHARVVVVGENFRFGYKQSGDTAALRQLGERYGFETRVMPAVKVRGRVVSSSAVRRAIESGHVALAGRLLGRCYALEGEVVSGHGVGSKQTVPTLNLHTIQQVLPAVGVYITRTASLLDPAQDEHSPQWNSITNIGYRPTFTEKGESEKGDGHELTIETFILDKFDSPAPRSIRVEFLRRVREERKFESPAALKTQILHDVGRAQAYFGRYSKWVSSSNSS